MAGDVLRLLLQKKPGHTFKGARASRPVERASRDALIVRRGLCMTEVMRLRRNGNVSGNLANKAYQLLTAHWAASPWRARTDIVRGAEWLLGVSRKVAGVPTPEHHVRKDETRARTGKSPNAETLVP